MDVVIYAIGLLIPLILTMTALLANLNKGGNIILALFAAMGGIVGIFFFTGVASDGSLFSGSVLLTSAATVQTWQFILLLPIFFALMSFLTAVYKVWS